MSGPQRGVHGPGATAAEPGVLRCIVISDRPQHLSYRVFDFPAYRPRFEPFRHVEIRGRCSSAADVDAALEWLFRAADDDDPAKFDCKLSRSWCVISIDMAGLWIARPIVRDLAGRLAEAIATCEATFNLTGAPPRLERSVCLIFADGRHERHFAFH